MRSQSTSISTAGARSLNRRPCVSCTLVVSLVVLATTAHGAAAQGSLDPARFARDIEAFEAADRVTPPKPDSTLFVGSSSIRYWDLAKAFPRLTWIQRGFGGSHVSDNIYYADRIIFPYKPKLIVFYAGDADVAANKNADSIFTDYKTLISLIHSRLPGTPLVIVGTKPSPAHWKQIETIRLANALVKEFVETDPLVRYVDVERPLLGADGQPRPDFFVDNGLNLSAAGYQAWTATVRPAVKATWPKR